MNKRSLVISKCQTERRVEFKKKKKGLHQSCICKSHVTSIPLKYTHQREIALSLNWRVTLSLNAARDQSCEKPSTTRVIYKKHLAFSCAVELRRLTPYVVIKG